MGSRAGEAGGRSRATEHASGTVISERVASRRLDCKGARAAGEEPVLHAQGCIELLGFKMESGTPALTLHPAQSRAAP